MIKIETNTQKAQTQVQTSVVRDFRILSDRICRQDAGRWEKNLRRIRAGVHLLDVPFTLFHIVFPFPHLRQVKSNFTRFFAGVPRRKCKVDEH